MQREDFYGFGELVSGSSGASKRFAWLVLVTGFSVWLIVGAYYVNTFDRYEVTTDERQSHGLVRGDAKKYWIVADRFSAAIQSGQSFIVASGEYRMPFLHPKLLALYGYVTNLEFFDSEGRITAGGKFEFLLLQALFYYVALWAFYTRLKEICPLRVANATLVFLALEPTILQYHASFWTESLFISFELLALALIIRPSRGVCHNLLLGFIVGLMCLQRPISTFYCFVVGAALLLRFGKSGIVASLAVVVPVLMFTGLIGFQNYSRMGVFYVTPTQSLDGPLNYVANYVVADVEGGDPKQARMALLSRADQVARERGLDLDLSDEVVRYRAYQIKRDLAMDIFLEYPLTTATRIGYHMAKSLAIDPLSVFWYTAFEYKPANKETIARTQELHSRIFRPVRYVYSLIILGLTLTGIYVCRPWENLTFHVLPLLSIVYFWILGGWVGDIRYMVPAIVFYSIYIGVAICWCQDRVDAYREVTGSQAGRDL